jgi:hypothetical protein
LSAFIIFSSIKKKNKHHQGVWGDPLNVMAQHEYILVAD